MGISALARNIGATPSSRDLSKTKINNKNSIFKILIMFNIQYNYFLVYFVTKRWFLNTPHDLIHVLLVTFTVIKKQNHNGLAVLFQRTWKLLSPTWLETWRSCIQTSLLLLLLLLWSNKLTSSIELMMLHIAQLPIIFFSMRGSWSHSSSPAVHCTVGLFFSFQAFDEHL